MLESNTEIPYLDQLHVVSKISFQTSF